MKDALGSVQSVLVLGGGSDIALATVRALVAGRARRMVLAARRPDQLGAAQPLERGRRLRLQVELQLRLGARRPHDHPRLVRKAVAQAVGRGQVRAPRGQVVDPLDGEATQ
jgi:decaprenylphospho-beta-D-erythro-pentofuranosid-2-ulose 2-reductase